MAMTIRRAGSRCAATLLLAAVGCGVESSSPERDGAIASTTEAVCDSNYCYSICYSPGCDISACMTSCMGGCSSPYHADSTGKLAQILSSGSYQVRDVRWLPNAVDRVVSFGFSAAARYGLPADFGGRCPNGAALLSSSSFQAQGLGGPDICVETTPTANDPWLQSQAAQYFQQLTNNPSSPMAALSGLRDAVDAVAQLLLTGIVCRTEENSNVTFCVTNTGGVSMPGTIGLGRGPCPVPWNQAAATACAVRGNQTALGCAVIECVEALNALGPVGCTVATQASIANTIPSLNSFWSYAGGASFCALIAEADHNYAAPGSGAVDLCSTTDSRCTRSFVRQTLLADIRRQAPFVLQGPPGVFPAAPLSNPLPIAVSNPSKLYYLGFSIPTGTSNPITVSVPSDLTLPIVNVANRDHMFEGVVDNYIVEEGGMIKVRAVGHGSNTRFALLNELVGPKVIRTTHALLRSAVQAALPPLPPPPPPPPRRPCPGCSIP